MYMHTNRYRYTYVIDIDISVCSREIKCYTKLIETQLKSRPDDVPKILQ